MPPAVGLPPARPHLWPRQRPLSRPTAADAVYDLDFVHGATAASLAAAGFTFARTGTAWDATGTSYATGVPRITSAGLLIEGARTNLLAYSQGYDGANWSRTAVGAVANAATAPDGTATAWLVTETGSTARLRPAAATTVVTATQHTASFLAKRSNHDWLVCLVSDSTSFTAFARCWFNLATGAVGTVSTAGGQYSSASGAIVSLGSGWYRCSLIFTTTPTSWYVGFSSAAADASSTRADVGGGAGVGSAYALHNVQLEQAAFASSPILTAGAAVTRNGETCIATRTNALLAQGSAVVSVTTAAGVEADQVAWSIDNNNSNNQTRLTLYRNFSANSLHLFMTDANVTQASIGSGASSVASLENHTAALRWAVNDVAMVMDGGTVGTDTSATMPSAIAYERLGGRVSTDRPFNGYIRRVIRSYELWPDAVLRARSGSS